MVKRGSEKKKKEALRIRWRGRGGRGRGGGDRALQTHRCCRLNSVLR